MIITFIGTADSNRMNLKAIKCYKVSYNNAIPSSLPNSYVTQAVRLSFEFKSLVGFDYNWN